MDITLSRRHGGIFLGGCGPPRLAGTLARQRRDNMSHSGATDKTGQFSLL
jgi:hypothetical protein